MTYHHLSVLVHRQAEKYGDKTALKYRDYEKAQWIPISWNEFSQTVRQAANAMVESTRLLQRTLWHTERKMVLLRTVSSC